MVCGGLAIFTFGRESLDKCKRLFLDLYLKEYTLKKPNNILVFNSLGIDKNMLELLGINFDWEFNTQPPYFYGGHF